MEEDDVYRQLIVGTTVTSVTGILGLAAIGALLRRKYATRVHLSDGRNAKKEKR
jgi:hypothetical protein